jgi:uncharacterized protein YcbX
MTVVSIWRYPVKSLAGERVASAQLTALGVPGDRIIQVVGPEGVRTARRHYRLLGLRGTLDADGRALIDGRPWDHPDALGWVREAAGPDAWLAHDEGPGRFDVLPLLVATDGAVAAFGRDVRRLRPNIVIGGVEGLAEFGWEGAELHIGDAVIGIDSRRGRCPMTTVDPDTLDRDPEVLREIGRRFGGRLALNAEVIVPGRIHVGDSVRLAARATA